MMTSWFKHARQTRTPVHSRDAQDRLQSRAIAGAYRTLGAAQVAAQLLLWVTLYGYDRAVQTTWQASAVQLLPLLVLWAMWRGGTASLSTPAGGRWALLVLPCLLLDATLCLRTLAGYIAQLIPEYPYAACVLGPAGLCFAAVLLARENGVAFGASVVRVALGALFLLGTLFLRSAAHTARLWPLLGQGVAVTGTAALSAAGGAWGVALLFLLPVRPAQEPGTPRAIHAAQSAKRTLFWVLVPWVMCLLWALFHGMVRPWRSGDSMAIGERLMGLARHARGILLYECTGLFWMLLLPIALSGGAAAGEKLLRFAFPKWPRSVAALCVLIPATAACLVWPDGLVNALGWALPWRAVLSLLAGAALCVLAARGKGKGGKRA